MRKNALVLSVVIAASSQFACQKEEVAPAPPATPPAAVAEKPAVAAPPANTAANAVQKLEEQAAQFAKSLDEEKVKKILVYEQELLPHTHLLMGAGMAAAKTAAAGGNIEKELSRDERIAKLNEVVTDALTKVGTTQQDTSSFATLTSTLYGSELAVADARQKLKDDKPKVAKWKKIEAQAEKLKGGENAMTVVKKYSADFLPIRKAQMDAVLGK